MRLSRLVGLARKVVEAQKNNEAAPQGPSILRLDDLLELRAPAEDLGNVESTLLEYYPKILLPITPPKPEDSQSRVIIGVDSSSRLVELQSATLVVSAVSVSSNKRGLSWDWPPVFNGVGPSLDEPVVRILPNDDSQVEVDDSLATSVNPAGYRYDPDYNQYQAMDEARVSAENRALEALAEILESKPWSSRTIILVDGPVFLVPGVLGSGQGRLEYVEAWRRLLRERVRVIERLASTGARVYGVVKRIEKARILGRARLPGGYKRCLGDTSGRSDLSLLSRALSARCYQSSQRGKPLASPPALVRSRGGPSKVAQYVILPQPWHLPKPGASAYYRVEEPYGQWSSSGGRLDGYRSPVVGVLFDSIARGSLEPVTIRWSDRRAREATRYLRSLLLRMALREGVPVTYGEMVEEAVEAWQRAVA